MILVCQYDPTRSFSLSSQPFAIRYDYDLGWWAFFAPGDTFKARTLFNLCEDWVDVQRTLRNAVAITFLGLVKIEADEQKQKTKRKFGRYSMETRVRKNVTPGGELQSAGNKRRTKEASKAQPATAQ